MDESIQPNDSQQTRRTLRIFLISGVVFIIGLVGYPLSSGPIIRLTHSAHELADVRKPVDSFYQSLLFVADAIAADRLLHRYLAMFDGTRPLRIRHTDSLLHSADVLMRAGKLDDAERLAERVHRFQLYYTLFEKTPEEVLHSISTLRSSQSR